MERILIRLLTLALGVPLLLYSGNGSLSDELARVEEAFNGISGQYVIYVKKADFSLTVYTKDLRAVKRFKIGYGLNPDKKPKLYFGDNRTPEGVYKITEILSLRAKKKTRAYKKLRAMNRIYFRARDGFYKYGREDVDLGRKAYGPRFFRLDYPNSDDKARYKKARSKGRIPRNSYGRIPSIGRGIAIHGNNDPPSIGNLCTNGCIRMHNRDIINLHKYIDVNTPVIISAE